MKLFLLLFTILSYFHTTATAETSLTPQAALKASEAIAASQLPRITLKKNDSIILLGGGTFSRMLHYQDFETELYMRYPSLNLKIRNLAKEGNSPALRPHASRALSANYAFPGAAEIVPKERANMAAGAGFRPTDDAWIREAQADIILACFGSHEHFAGEKGLEIFRKELDGFAQHTLSTHYNGKSPPKLILVTPNAFENQDLNNDLPKSEQSNQSLARYCKVIRDIATKHQLPCIDLFKESLKLYSTPKASHAPSESIPRYSRDTMHLNKKGYKAIAKILAQHAFTQSPAPTLNEDNRNKIANAVAEKNWVWFQYFKVPNGIHVYGRRHGPHGPKNYPEEQKKLAKMVDVRDQAIHAIANNEAFNLTTADATTGKLPAITTNYQFPTSQQDHPLYSSPQESLKSFQLPMGYKIQLFADESRFPNLANPSQMAFDTQGRLWVGVMPSYPHWKPGDPKPNDKILIYEDTNNDGIADVEKVFADGLHLITGFELVKNNKGQREVYCAQDDALVLFTDTNGDDLADKKEIILAGFCDHDSHHKISAFRADPMGGIIMGEGWFKVSSVESPYGALHTSGSGFYRFDPHTQEFNRHANVKAANPWGTIFDDYGQGFYLVTSFAGIFPMEWGAHRYIPGYKPQAPSIIKSNAVRPCSGIEIMSSRHFPAETRNDIVLLNCKNFLGAKQQQLIDKGAGFETKYRQDLFKSSNPNVRPVDLSIAPDGSLFVLDWHNRLVGHAQHSARDPLRDHQHGRIYRITYPALPLIEPAHIDGASIDTLLSNLTLPESQSRYRTRRELRSKSPAELSPKLKAWAKKQSCDRHKLEALWVSCGINHMDTQLFHELIRSTDYRIRTAALLCLRYHNDQIDDYFTIVKKAANDPHPRVRFTAMNLATFFSPEQITDILNTLSKYPIDSHSKQIHAVLNALSKGLKPSVPFKLRYPNHIKSKAAKLKHKRGFLLYNEEGKCATCHKSNGKGLYAAGYPPLQRSKWIQDTDQLIKIALHGAQGPIHVHGQQYNSMMPGFQHMFTDEEMADVLSYIRNTWAKEKYRTTISSQTIKNYRAKYKSRIMPWKVEELQQN